MKYTVNEKKEGNIRVDFVLDAKEWEEALEAAYNREKGKYKKEGFRQGKVPRKVLESTFGEGIFFDEAFNISFTKSYVEMLGKETQIKPIDYPEIDVTELNKEGVKFSASITVMPEVTLGKHTGVEIKIEEAQIDEKEVDKEIEALRERNARYVEIKDRVVKDKDLVNLDYSGSVEGKKFEGGTAKNQELEIGSKTFIEGFEGQLVGMKIGEEKNISVKFPEKYHSKDLAGKPAVFAVKILGIRERQVPELTDEFAKDVSEFSTVIELKNNLKERLLAQKQESIQRQAENKLVQTIVKNSKVEIPEKMIEKQLDYFVHDFEHMLSHQGLSFADYLNYIGKTEKEYRDLRREEAKVSCETNMVLDEIVKKNNITATEEEINSKLTELTPNVKNGQKNSKKDIDENQIKTIKNHIIAEKTIKFLLANNSIKKGDNK